MRKYENVDVAAVLSTVMKSNTQHYQSDFKYDKEMFTKAATELDGENNRLLWLSRTSGTECFKERDVFLKEHTANITWKYHADTDNILAYAVNITGVENGKVMGDLYELDYKRQVEQVRRNELPIATVALKFEDGTTGQYPYDEFKKNRYNLEVKHGEIIHLHYAPENADSLKRLLEKANNERQKSSIRKQLAKGNTKTAVATEKTKSKSTDLEH